jgi:F-type H+-transporting ATPase subunit delta
MASVTNTYARALADVVFARRLDPGKALRELQSLTQLVTSSTELREVWETPSITAEQKRAVLDAIVSREGISSEVRNFVAVLIDHHRINFLKEIAKQFEHELSERLGFVEAEITSARELNGAERSILESEVAKLTGKKVHAYYLRAESLLGGAVVRIGSTIYDGSVDRQLQRIREKIALSS